MADLARIFQAVGNDARIKILTEIARCREACVCELMTATGMGQSAVSHHLAVLRNAGLVHDRKSGLWVFYSIDEDLLRTHAVGFISDLLRHLDQAPMESPEARLTLKT